MGGGMKMHCIEEISILAGAELNEAEGDVRVRQGDTYATRLDFEYVALPLTLRLFRLPWFVIPTGYERCPSTAFKSRRDGAVCARCRVGHARLTHGYLFHG